MIGTLGIPVLNRGDLLMRCIKSIDHPINTLFIVNNGNDQGVADVASLAEQRKFENQGLFENIRVEKHKNLGCGPSWNHIALNAPAPWFFSGNDMKFLPGSVALLDKTLDQNPDAAEIMAYHYSAFLLTEKGFKIIGRFDENFYPAYFEDCDHYRRMILAGFKDIRVPGFECVHGEAPYWGSSTIKSDPELNRKNGITFSNLQAYYIRKWGGEPGKETYTKPFNKDLPLDYWERDIELRKANSLW